MRAAEKNRLPHSSRFPKSGDFIEFTPVRVYHPARRTLWRTSAGFVRGCQLEGMIYDDDAGVPAELIRVANQMRKDPVNGRRPSRFTGAWKPEPGIPICKLGNAFGMGCGG